MGEEASFDVDMIPVHFMPGIFDVAAQWQQIEKKATALGGVVFVAVDTAPAYFTGDEENSNTQLGAHARKLRTLTTLPGRPTVIANCHPTKSANSDSLVPRGGGAFLGEVDGNLTSVREDRIVRLHWAGKIRGPDFEAVPFELVTIRTPRLVDSKGRQLPTVMARPLTPTEETNREEEARKDEDAILAAMKASPGASLANLAEMVGWTVGAGGAPYKSKVERVLKRLKTRKTGRAAPRQMASHQGREGGLMTTSKSPEIRRPTPLGRQRRHRPTFSSGTSGTKSGTGTLKPRSSLGVSAKRPCPRNCMDCRPYLRPVPPPLLRRGGTGRGALPAPHVLEPITSRGMSHGPVTPTVSELVAGGVLEEEKNGKNAQVGLRQTSGKTSVLERYDLCSEGRH